MGHTRQLLDPGTEFTIAETVIDKITHGPHCVVVSTSLKTVWGPPIDSVENGRLKSDLRVIAVSCTG